MNEDKIIYVNKAYIIGDEDNFITTNDCSILYEYVLIKDLNITKDTILQPLIPMSDYPTHDAGRFCIQPDKVLASRVANITYLDNLWVPMLKNLVRAKRKLISILMNNNHLFNENVSKILMDAFVYQTISPIILMSVNTSDRCIQPSIGVNNFIFLIRTSPCSNNWLILQICNSETKLHGIDGFRQLDTLTFGEPKTWLTKNDMYDYFHALSEVEKYSMCEAIKELPKGNIDSEQLKDNDAVCKIKKMIKSTAENIASCNDTIIDSNTSLNGLTSLILRGNDIIRMKKSSKEKESVPVLVHIHKSNKGKKTPKRYTIKDIKRPYSQMVVTKDNDTIIMRKYKNK